jgi:peptidoglycan/xylan/chitin deacetylase (PgdA/CDA1 family)
VTLRGRAGTLAAAVRRAGSRLAGRAAVTLVVDDGPAAVTRSLLDILDGGGHRAVFFVIGHKAAAREDTLVEILQRGHHLGNHSYSHPRFSELSLDAARNELLATEQVIAKAYERARLPRPGRWFRFPYHDDGAANSGTFQELLAELQFEAPPGLGGRAGGQRTGRLDWPSTLITHDWERPSVPRFRRSLLRARPGDLIEIHDDRWNIRHYGRPLVQMLALLRLRGELPA